MNKEGAERMLALADYLERLDNDQTELDPLRFDMRVWQSPYAAFTKWLDSSYPNHPKPPKPKCGTVACAVGHIPNALPDSGFSIQGSEDTEFYPTYNGHHSWHAVEAFFDITNNQAFNLFSPDSYCNPNDIEAVVTALRDFVQLHFTEKEPANAS